MNNLGKRARDKVTGFSGIITGKASYLYGCDQYCIVPRVQNGEIKHGEWFDAGRVDIVGDGILPADVQDIKPGGPNRDCPR